LHAAPLERLERGGERIHAHAFAVKRNADRFDAQTLQPRERALISRLFDDYGVAALQKDSVHQIERLQGTRGDEDLVGIAANAGGAFELSCQKLAQRPIAERAAGEAVSGEVAALARQHVVHRFDQCSERQLLGVVMAADEIVFGETGPFGRRRRQAGGEQRSKVQRSHGHSSLIPGH
jgi:hypothetical protein